ncbi:Uncharacterized protein FWK35_00035606, partial [Aphis craccivora]
TIWAYYYAYTYVQRNILRYKVPIHIAQYNRLPTMSDVTEVISLCIHVRVQRYDDDVCACAHCGEHNTSVTGPDHPAHTYRAVARRLRCTLSACARPMEIVRRGRVLPSLLHGPQDTGTACVSFMPVVPTSYNVLPVYTVCTHRSG